MAMALDTGKEAKEFIDSTAEYLEANEVYDLFNTLLKQLLIHQPDDPVAFLIKSLKNDPEVKICIIGGTGAMRTQLCKKLAEEHNAKHVHAGELLQKARAAAGTTGDALKAEASDQEVSELVTRELNALGTSGWLLDGYPRTRVQAQTLQMQKLIPDRVLVLQPCPKGPLEVFANSVLQVDGSKSPEEVYLHMQRCLALRPLSSAPLRPLRAAYIGPLGSGRTTQSLLLAETYGLAYVDVSALINELIDDGKLSEDIAEEYVQDDVICEAVSQRLQRPDCLHRGFVLDGFPKTLRQAMYLRQLHKEPSRLVHLKLPSDVSMARAEKKRGMADPAQDTLRYQRYEEHIEAILAHYTRQKLELDGQESTRTLHEASCAFIDRQLATGPLAGA